LLGTYLKLKKEKNEFDLFLTAVLEKDEVFVNMIEGGFKEAQEKQIIEACCGIGIFADLSILQKVTILYRVNNITLDN